MVFWFVTGIYFSCVSQTKLSLPLWTVETLPPLLVSLYSGYRTHPCGHSHTRICVIKSALTSAFADFVFSFPPMKHALHTCLCLCLPLLTSVCHDDGIYHSWPARHVQFSWGNGSWVCTVFFSHLLLLGKVFTFAPVNGFNPASYLFHLLPFSTSVQHPDCILVRIREGSF